MIELMNRFEWRCALTGSDDIHIDHWFPKSYGGYDDITNLYPLDATLNERKGASNPFEFFEREDIRVLFPKERFDDVVFWLAIQNGMTVEEFRSMTNERYYEASQIK